jgi:hypothetical protein
LLGVRASRLPARLFSALAVGPRFDAGNFPTPLLLSPDGADRLVIDLHRLCDLAIGLLGRRLDQLGNKLALLLGAQMAPSDVGADHVRIRVNRRVERDHPVAGQPVLARADTRRADNRGTDRDLDGIEPTAAVEQLQRRSAVTPQRDRRREAVFANVFAERREFVGRHRREEFAGGMDGQRVAPG